LLTESGTLPAGLTFVDNGNGTATISDTPEINTGGVFPVTILAQNTPSSIISENLNLVVDPVLQITSPASANFSNIPAIFGVGSNALASQPLDHPTFSEVGALPAGLTFDPAGSIGGSSTAIGTSSIAVTAHTPDGQSSPPQTLTLTVGLAPTITVSNHFRGTFYQGQTDSYTFTASGSPNPTFTETGALPAGVTFVDNGNGTATLAGTPAAGTIGAYSIVITAQNAFGSSGLGFYLSVLTLTAPVSITSAARATFTAGQPGSFTVTMSGNPVPVLKDLGGALPGGVTFVDNGNGTATISGTPGSSLSGPFFITIDANNSIPASGTYYPDARQNFELDVNQPPALTATGSTTFTVGQSGYLPLQLSGFPAVTVTMTGTLPTGVTFESSSGLVGTPTPGTGGSYPVMFDAHNGVGSDATLNLTLTVNQTPMITSKGFTTFVAGQANTFTVQTTGSPTATITESGALPPGVTFTANGNGTATLSGTPDPAHSNVDYPLTITAHNGAGPDSVQDFDLSVNFPPVFVNPNSTTLTVGQSGSFLVAASGVPTPAITVTGNLPTGVTVQKNPDGSETLTGTPAVGTGGVYRLTVTANNGAGPVASEAFTLTVNEDARFTSANSITDLVDYPIDLNPTAIGNPKPVFIGYTGQLPSYISYDPTQDLYSGVPQATTPSGQPDLIHLVINNVDGTTTTQTVQLTVLPQPRFTSASSATFPLGQPGSFTVTTNSPVTPALFVSGFLPPGITFVDNHNGTGTFSGTSNYAGAFQANLGATVYSSTIPSTFTLNVVGQPTQFTSGTSTTFDEAHAGSFTVTATGAPTPTLSLQNVELVAPNGLTATIVPLPSGVSFVANPGGTATLSGTPAVGTAGTYKLSIFANNGIGAGVTQTLTLDIQSGAATALTAAGFPSPVNAGVANSVTVTARDSSGNVALGYTGTVSFSSSDGQAVLPASYTFTAADGGVHSFIATLKTAGTQSITATDSTTSTLVGSDAGITVNPAAASKFLVSAPASVNTGAAFSPTVTVVDAYGNVVTGYTGTVSFSSSDGQAVLPANYTFTAADQGVHTFSATLKTAGTQSLTATDTTTTSLKGTASAIAVSAAAVPSKLLVIAPTSATAGTASSVTVTAVDSSGKTVTGYTGTVSFSSSDGQAVLPSSYTFTAADQGVHTFSVTLKTAGTRSITATDTTTTSITGTDTAITVSPAAASKLLVSAPASVQQGTSFSVTVTVQDPYGNTVTGYTGTIALSSSDSHAVLPSSYSYKSSDQGVHTFSVTLKTAGTQSITAKDTKNSSLTGSASHISVAGFTVNDGSPQQSMVTSLIYTFAAPTQVEPGAFKLLRNGKPTSIRMTIAPQPDGTTYLITFHGPGVVHGSVPNGEYTLITLYGKVNVLSGPPLTENDVNTFNRLLGDLNGDGKVNGADKAWPNPPTPSPAKFPGRKAHHHGPIR
jgi:hypothetical protein